MRKRRPEALPRAAAGLLGVVVASAIAAEPGPSPRDPFRPFATAAAAKPREAPRTPLEQIELSALKLVAILHEGAGPKAMVEDDATLGYTIGIGTRIGSGGGVVKAIAADRVIVEETTVDPSGAHSRSEVVLRLRPDGEKRP